MNNDLPERNEGDFIFAVKDIDHLKKFLMIWNYSLHQNKLFPGAPAPSPFFGLECLLVTNRPALHDLFDPLEPAFEALRSARSTD